MLAACGQTGCACAALRVTPSPSTPTSPDPRFDVLITDQDRDVAVKLGQTVEVYLPQRTGMTRWSQVVADDTSVLRPINIGILVPANATIGGFVAEAAGVANLTAYASPQCKPNEACPMYAMLFQVRVTVS